MEIKKVGVVGCGLMGAGITQVCAQSGYQVVVLEINLEFLNKGLASIDRFLTGSVTRGRLSQVDKDAITSRIKGTTDNRDFSDCDLIVEAAIENLDLKKKIFTDLGKVSAKRAILATNTTCLSVTDIAVVSGKPDKVLGTHFFNPVPLMKLLEMVRTIMTSEDTVTTVKAFCESLGKTVVVVRDGPGFVSSRLLFPFLLDAARMLEAGVATREDIDAVVKLGLNHPMGPLELADHIGIDVAVFASNAMYEELKDPRFAVPTLMRKMVTAGWLGRKTGKGFYDYK